MTTETRILPDREHRWAKLALGLVAGTMAYNVIEAVVALWAGAVAESVALLGFGLDSLIEMSAGATLWMSQPPEESLVGIMLAVLSLLVIPLLAWGKLHAASRIGSSALRAEAKETLACSYLSFTLLLGLAANATAGWWWADPVSAPLMVPWLVKEGFEGPEQEEDDD